MACLWNFFLVLFQDCLSKPDSGCFCWTFLQLASLVLSLALLLGLSLDCFPCAFLGLIFGAFHIFSCGLFFDLFLGRFLVFCVWAILLIFQWANLSMFYLAFVVRASLRHRYLVASVFVSVFCLCTRLLITPLGASSDCFSGPFSCFFP